MIVNVLLPKTIRHEHVVLHIRQLVLLSTKQPMICVMVISKHPTLRTIPDQGYGHGDV